MATKQLDDGVNNKKTTTLRTHFGIDAADNSIVSGHPAGHHRAASDTMRQLQFAIADLLSSFPEDLHYPCFFSHIFIGMYAAGYYGYLGRRAWRRRRFRR